MAAIQIPEEGAPRYGGTFDLRLNPWSDVAYRGPILVLLGAAALYGATLIPEPALATLCQAMGSVMIALAAGLGLMGYQAATWPDFRLRLEARSLQIPAHPSWLMETTLLSLNDIQAIDIQPAPEGPAMHVETRDRVYVIPARWLRSPWTPQVFAYRLQLRWVLRQRPLEQLVAAEAALMQTDRPAWGVVVDPVGNEFHPRWIVHNQEEYRELAAARQVSPEHRLIVLSQVFPGFQEAFRPHPYRKLAAAAEAPPRAASASNEASTPG
jgi:hypothetical protein